MSGSGPSSSHGTAPFSATHTNTHTQTRAGVQRREMHCGGKTKPQTLCRRAHLIIAVVEVDEDVQDLQQSSDGVDHLQRHVRLQNPIIQPAQVAAKANKQTSVDKV